MIIQIWTLRQKIRDYSWDVMSDEKHNGWTNRATWNVSAWLSNEREIYQMSRALKMIEASQFENFCRYIWKSQTPDGFNLSDVNWQEIADAMGHQE